MIQEVRFENILSFKEEQIFSFEATSDKDFLDLYTVEVKPNVRLLKLGIIYGANASGKTNFLLALNSLRKIVLESKDNKFDKTDFIPFMLDYDTPKKKGSYYLSFFIENTRFIYTISLNKKLIVYEKLVYYPSIQPATLYTRNYDEENDVTIIKFGDKLNLSNKEELILESNTINNSSLLSIYNKLNIKIHLFDKVLFWFKNNFMKIINPTTKLTGWTSNRLENQEDCKNFIIDALKKADFNISDIIIDNIEEGLDEKLTEIIKDSNRISKIRKEEILKEKKIKLKSISFQHSTPEGDFNIPLGLQSNGTKRYYGLAGVLNAIINENKVLLVDELETSLHYELANHFLKTYLVNSSRSQLLFTTHNISFLMEDFLRRDVVWFCEKKENGQTELYSASDISIHKNISLFNAYKIGKMGAKPNLGDIYLNING